MKYPGGVTISDRPDQRGYWRVRGPGLDRRTRDLQEAERIAWDHARQLHDSGEDRADSEAEKSEDGPTVSELAEAYLSRKRLAANTIRTMTANLRRHALPLLGNLPCAQWTSEHTRRVRDACIEHGLAESSTSKVMNDLSAVARYGRELGWLGEQQLPCQGLVKGTRPALQRGALPTHDDIQNFAHALVQVTGQEWRRLQVQLLAYAGLRSCELLGLQPRDLDGGVLHVERQLVGRQLEPPKHGILRDTIYPAWMDGPLHAWAAQQDPDGPLFPAAKGGYEPYATWLRQRWQPAAEVAAWPRMPNGRRKWTAHTLRHFFGTWALAKDGLNMDVADVAMFMGHSSPEVTHRLYVQSRTDRFARARAATGAPA